MDLPVKLGDAQEFLMLVPSPLAERVAEDERLVVAAYRFRGAWASGLDGRWPRVSSMR